LPALKIGSCRFLSSGCTSRVSRNASANRRRENGFRFGSKTYDIGFYECDVAGTNRSSFVRYVGGRAGISGVEVRHGGPPWGRQSRALMSPSSGWGRCSSSSMRRITVPEQYLAALRALVRTIKDPPPRPPGASMGRAHARDRGRVGSCRTAGPRCRAAAGPRRRPDRMTPVDPRPAPRGRVRAAGRPSAFLASVMAVPTPAARGRCITTWSASRAGSTTGWGIRAP
jgi:hypothetical protein